MSGFLLPQPPLCLRGVYRDKFTLPNFVLTLNEFKWLPTCTPRFAWARKFCVLSAPCVIVSRMTLIINSHYLPTRHLSIGLSNGSILFSVRYELNLYT